MVWFFWCQSLRAVNKGLRMQIVGDKFGMGMDDTHMKLRGAPVLDEPALSTHQKMIADKLTVSELMTVSIIALPPVVKVIFLPTLSSSSISKRALSSQYTASFVSYLIIFG